jgi:hypothetical protein
MRADGVLRPSDEPISLKKLMADVTIVFCLRRNPNKDRAEFGSAAEASFVY